MTDLLLITDVPRLRAVFGKLGGDKNTTLRVASSLEQGVAELLAEKPTIIFVQSHLSGFSGDILLQHLKKQLGRKRSRFVLLSAPGQSGPEAQALYQGCVDTSLEDADLLAAVRATIADLLKPGKKPAVQAHATDSAPITPPDEEPQPRVEVVQPEPAAVESPVQQQTFQPEVVTAAETVSTLPAAVGPVPPSADASLEEQGVTYSPTARLKVYSEFTSSFDSAVSNLDAPAPVSQAPTEPTDWEYQEITADEPKRHSRLTTFLVWLLPVLVAVVAVTLVQHRKSTPTAVQKPATPPGVTAALPQTDVAKPAAPPSSPAVSTPVAAAPTKADSTADARLSDKAVLSAIAENRTAGATKPTTVTRPTELPDFIPRSGLDKEYGKANPGWERFKGNVTEFKVYREANAIKAIQIIDRGGNGVPESFMKGVLRQVAKKPAFVQEAAEKKEGYEIQRGQVADGLKVVYYRDAAGGKLRAFVLTWQ